MEPITFHLPTYPVPAQFSDPYNDWGDFSELEAIRRRDPRTLSGRDLCYIFNGCLPAGTFEEMAAYVPHALRLLAEGDAPNTPPDLVDHLIHWCHTEQEALARDSQFLTGMQDAFIQLFTYWTSRTAWWKDRHGCYLSHAGYIDSLLSIGDYIATSSTWRKPLPWLASAHYLPRFLVLDTVPHAAWLLYVSDPERIWEPILSAPAATRRRAVEMVEEWLLTTATPEDIELWDELLVRHRCELALFSDAP